MKQGTLSEIINEDARYVPRELKKDIIKYISDLIEDKVMDNLASDLDNKIEGYTIDWAPQDAYEAKEFTDNELAAREAYIKNYILPVLFVNFKG